MLFSVIERNMNIGLFLCNGPGIYVMELAIEAPAHTHTHTLLSVYFVYTVIMLYTRELPLQVQLSTKYTLLHGNCISLNE